MLKRLGPFINLMLSHYLLATDIQFDYSTVGIYMSATGCVIGAIGFGFHSKTERNVKMSEKFNKFSEVENVS